MPRLPIALLALAAACGSTPNRPVSQERAPGAARAERAPVSPAPSGGADGGGAGLAEGARATPAASGGLVARVAGAELTAAELLEAWLLRDSPAVRATLEELVLSRLVLIEAGEHGIEVPPQTLQAAVAEVRSRLEQQVQRGGSGLTVDQFVKRRLGLDPKRYFERLDRETAVDLLAERVVRSWLLASERAEVRAIVVKSQADADVVQAKLAQGEEFEALARQYSTEESAETGGRVPPVVRGPSALARLAFSTPVGEVGGPVEEGGQWLFLRVDGRPAPLTGSWTEVGPSVEASLADDPISDPEYWQWKSAMLERYEVDMTPLFDLVGHALAE